MRSTLITAALAIGAIAQPLEKRRTFTEYEIVYVTQVVTVTAGAHPTTNAQVPAPLYTSTRSPPPVSSVKTSTHAAAPVSTVQTSTRSAAPVSTVKSSTSAAAASPAAAKPTSYSQIAVYHHNLHRANHSSPDLKWSDSLASTAATIASSCKYAHNVAVNGGGYGQNIAAGVRPDNISAIITDLFYNGEVGWYNNLYGQAQPDMTNFEHWGHFSQIVWKGTGSVGCATQDCSAQGLQGVSGDVAPFFTVCNYASPGNYANEYGANVLAPLNHPTARWNAGL